ncbi:hypothetical protein [Blautia glucerasea]|uniref:hypothetical protein n=1 Tax=Blautia glucerasea TaxID=536633 RepID=UPI001D088EDB|nr:hypothetical protein [Blautia glucerasea]MCB6546289.1 hypothetical protein [Blautia glucerasea]
MNISMRDKKLLLMFSGVAVFGLGWFFGYRPQMEEAANIEAANKPLEERLSNLLELAGNRDFYISETENAQNKINEYVSKFPSDVKEENGIVLAQNIENSLGMQISNVGIATKEFVASIDGSTEEEIAEQNETMSEQANSQTREQIDEIEGTDSKAAEELQNASDIAAAQADSTSQTPVLYRTQDTLEFNGTYANLKDVVAYLAEQTGRLTVDNMNASYDTSTGYLTGSIVVNMFSMTGTGNIYTEPDAGQVAYGTSNLFGTLEKAAANTAQTSEENGSDGQSDNGQEGENTDETAAPADDQGQS